MRNILNDNRMVLVQEEPRGPSQLIEVPVTQNGITQVNFPDIANLRNQADQVIIIKSIQLITPSILTNGPVTGFALAPLTELQKMSAILYSEGWEKGQLIPLLTMNSVFTEGSGEPWSEKTMRLDSWKNLDWNKSKIVYSNGTVSVGQPYAIVFDVQYVKLAKNMNGQWDEIVGPA